MRRPGLLLLKYFTSREHISPPVVENSICLKGKTVLSRQRNAERYAGKLCLFFSIFFSFPFSLIIIDCAGGFTREAAFVTT